MDPKPCRDPYCECEPGACKRPGHHHPADAPDAKPTNPKDALASTRLPFHLVPGTMEMYASLAFAEGALKYGAYNWRIAGVRASVYVSACQRHLKKWFNGEEVDPKTGVPHLSSALACIAIILDARACGMLTDDRPPALSLSAEMEAMKAVIGSLQAQFAGMNPRHCTIADRPPG
jgi:hypothetical protein